MKILFCSHNPLDPRLGAPKVIIELATALEALGWKCRLAADEEICPRIRSYTGLRRTLEFSSKLATYLERHAKDYDVADYDHLYLPYPRARFPASTLLVARSVLLNQHFEKIQIPRFKRARSLLGAALKGPFRHGEMKLNAWLSTRTFRSADLINVSNDQDRDELVSRGFAAEQVVVIPFGLSQARFKEFDAITPTLPATPRLAFVGTFDLRKGAREFPDIVRHVVNAVPGCKIRLLGARYRGVSEVLGFFPKDLHANLEIVSDFDPSDLPQKLQDCSLGIFPSYLEGFGFGVLEMLAASLPVIAYDSPGPPMMLPKSYLVPRGDWQALASQAVALLTDPQRLASGRVWAKARAHEFTWERFAQATSQAYTRHCELLRSR